MPQQSFFIDLHCHPNYKSFARAIPVKKTNIQHSKLPLHSLQEPDFMIPFSWG